MSARLDLFANPVAAKALKHFASASMAIIKESTLPASTRDMVMLRASQINGCGYCTDAHSKDLAHGGEDATRINLVAAWRESNVFTDAERAALELAEEGTRIADGKGVSDEVWENAAAHYDEAQLADLLVVVSLINASNRMGVINKQPGGDYKPGQFGY
ncbi:carboxymuconolactone decarboxylase family protein [Actinomadura logoneensis]|uniref:Carboxymuconolactone decarboxylase family protein n=1 Tax=Actinomadura logoneensis TaxID=2293572 RepID=A0A372JQR1_9ACTN|nr:carboxymuconolactone decarboxylase family protein [Actinomadura logoneensis]RFU42372.1 carboxymuconolactone decarboxylase family protein [Actinomadura logoneensis]